MKRYGLLLLPIVLCINGVAQDLTSKPLSIGETHDFYSTILQEKRTVNVYLPLNYQSEETYPIIYLLDGSLNEDFVHITGLVQFFNLQFKMPDFIIVGIANVDRKRDFTFHTDLTELQKEYPTTGHSDLFIKFLEEELKPFIKTKYNTAQTEYLIGQSLGGLLATEILVKNPNLFSHYLIVSPSLWWDDGSLLTFAKSGNIKEQVSGKFVYLSVGEKEHAIMKRDAKEMLQQLKKAGATVEFNLMKDETHASILHRSIYEGFLILFPYKE